MKRTAVALAIAIVAGSASAALAQSSTTGWYTGLKGGANLLQDATTTGTNGSALSISNSYDTGYGLVGFGGYDFGALRAEFEMGYRRNSVDKLTVRNDGGIPAVAGAAAQTGTTPSGSGSASAFSTMGNVFYDIDMGSTFEPYLGLGLGVAQVTFSNIAGNGVRYTDDSSWRLAYQAMAGVAYWLSNDLALTADYRYFGTANPRLRDTRNQSFESEYQAHSIMVGLTYRFGAPPPPPPPPPPAPVAAAPPAPPPAVAPPPPAPPAMPAGPKQFLVFFDFDKSDITAQAQRIINDAAAEWKKTGTARVTATGHADRAGTDRYNQRLSERRAAAVKDSLVKQGVPANNIVTIGRGESQPLVPTADGVREPQNRRVEIVF
jgi:outer membrane protein OmpA-like peptidoglycan-associated protein